jgi:hypothetical protein
MKGFRPPKSPALPEVVSEAPTAAEYAALVRALRTYFAAVDGVFALMARDFPMGAALPEFNNDTAAAAGGVALYGFYRQGSHIHQRVT